MPCSLGLGLNFLPYLLHVHIFSLELETPFCVSFGNPDASVRIGPTTELSSYPSFVCFSEVTSFSPMKGGDGKLPCGHRAWPFALHGSCFTPI
jgi:hypothetical protein